MNENKDLTSINKEASEWQLDQLFKLESELTMFNKQTMKTWNECLSKEKTTEVEPSKLVPNKYRDMWMNAWEGSKTLILSASLEQQSVVNWLLDKRMKLRRELEEYGQNDFPDMKEVLAGDAESLKLADDAWCSTWENALSLVTPKDMAEE